jgi:uncharacterized protein (DUF849 family)
MARAQDKVIISCAVTGSVHTPAMSPYLPLTPQQIAEQAIEAAEAGAAILHLHARDPADGRPTADPKVFDQFVPRIRAATDAVINITTGGSTRMTLEERLAYPLQAKPEMCSLNMGSMNFSIHPAARKIKEWQHDWEKPYVEGHGGSHLPQHLPRHQGHPEDAGRRVRHALRVRVLRRRPPLHAGPLPRRGAGRGPLFIQGIFGILGGIGPDPENLMFMKSTADRLFGDGYRFSLLGAGRHQMSLLTMGAVLGANVRVGLEDSLYLGKGQLAKSCAEQVRKIRRILEELSLEIATPDEARAMLSLKGADQVAF